MPTPLRHGQPLLVSRLALPVAVLLAALCGLPSPGAAAEQPDVSAEALATGPAQLAPQTDGDGAGIPRRRRFRRRRRKPSFNAEMAREGEQELQRSVRVFQQRYLVKTGRVEVQGGGSVGFGDSLMNHTALEAAAFYHINESWALGISGAKWSGEESERFKRVQSDFGLFPERSVLQAGGFLEAQWSPVFAKFTTFGLGIVQFDAFLSGGGGVVRTLNTEDLKAAFSVGGGIRLHVLRWLTLSFDLKDMMHFETFQRGDELMHRVFAGMRLGFWIPPTFTYQYER
jgi:outer membrane beta-barrel protein